MMLASGSVRNVLSNVRLLLTTFMVGTHAGKLTSMDLAVPSGVRLPYALAIGLGTLAQIGWMLFVLNLPQIKAQISSVNLSNFINYNAIPLAWSEQQFLA